MCTGFLNLLGYFSPINIRFNIERFKYSYILENKNFPDCTNKEFHYSKKPWNPSGKTGFGHHGANGWDFGLPEELK